MSENYPSLCCGLLFTISIDDNGNIWSFGCNKNGECGHNNKNQVVLQPKQIDSLFNIKTVSCGCYHSICCDYNGLVFSFGYNDYNQLGIGKDKFDIPFSFIPQQLNIPPVSQISCGYYFTICITYNGTLWSFGRDEYGQLGLNQPDYVLEPQEIPNIKNIEFVSCGGNFVFCKTFNGLYYSWGYNNHGQIGHNNLSYYNTPKLCEDWDYTFISIKCGLKHSLFLNNNGQIYTCGCNDKGQLGIEGKSISKKPILIENIPEIYRIECGYDFCLCIDIDNNVWVFGDNCYDQLGTGGINKLKKKPFKNSHLTNIVDISAGRYHAFVQTNEKHILAFGRNDSLQLGIKTSTTTQNIPIRTLQDCEYIWSSNIGKSRAKSARK